MTDNNDYLNNDTVPAGANASAGATVTPAAEAPHALSAGGTVTPSATGPGPTDSAEKSRGTASLIAATLISDAGFRHGVTPGGYARNELNSVCYAELTALSGENLRGEPGEADLQRWEQGFKGIVDRLAAISVRRTAISYYLIFVIDAACRRGEGDAQLRAVLGRVQKYMEQTGMIAETLDVDPEAGTYRVVSGRKLDNKYIRTALDKALAGPELSGVERQQLAEHKYNTTAAQYRALEAGTQTRTRRGPSLMIFLIAANALVFALGLYMEYRTGTNWLVEWGIQDNALIRQGEWWRLVTSMFLHADWMHLLSNMLFLYMLSRALDRYYSTLSLGLIYFFGGLAGNLLGLLFSTALSLGASGAIMGLGGALLYRMTLGKNAKLFRQAGNFTWLALTVGFNLIYGLFTPGIDNYGHFGGFIGGFVTALLIGIISDRRAAARAGGVDGVTGSVDNAPGGVDRVTGSVDRAAESVDRGTGGETP